jgi:hypothetical protein
MELNRYSKLANELQEGDVVAKTTGDGEEYYYIDAEPFYDIDEKRWHCWIKKLTWDQVLAYFSDDSNEYVQEYFPEISIEDWDIEHGRNNITFLSDT